MVIENHTNHPKLWPIGRDEADAGKALSKTPSTVTPGEKERATTCRSPPVPPVSLRSCRCCASALARTNLTTQNPQGNKNKPGHQYHENINNASVTIFPPYYAILRIDVVCIYLYIFPGRLLFLPTTDSMTILIEKQWIDHRRTFKYIWKY